MGIEIKSIKLDAQYQKEANRRRPLYDELQSYLGKAYDKELKRLCERLISETENEKNRSLALLESIRNFFQTQKEYDWKYYDAVHKRTGSFAEDIIDYKIRKYKVDDEEKIGYYTPNDKKSILLLTNKMICNGCADLVEDILDYCNKKDFINIAHIEASTINHAWNKVAIRKDDGQIHIYDFDMSKGTSRKANTIFSEQSNFSVGSDRGKKEFLENQLRGLEKSKTPENQLKGLGKSKAREIKIKRITYSSDYYQQDQSETRGR